MRSKGPPKPAIPSGPNCDGCPYRSLSMGYAPPSGPSEPDVMFMGSRLGRDEVEGGRVMIGGMGKVFNVMLSESGYTRSHVLLDNAVRCRPIVWTSGPNGPEPAVKKNGDHVDCEPTTGQVRECMKRYPREFKGRTIVTMGQAALYAYTGRLSVTEALGATFRPGIPRSCATCIGAGTLPNLKLKKDPVCKGRGCSGCFERGKVPYKNKDWRVTCKHCKGSGTIPEEGNYLSDKLLPHQLLLPTYHVAYCMKNQAVIPLVKRHFSRVRGLHEESADPILYHLDISAASDAALLASSGPVSVDIETNGGLDPRTHQVSMIGATERAEYGTLISAGAAKELFESDRLIIGQNYVEFDAWFMNHYGFPYPKGGVWDTKYAGHLVNPDTPNDLISLSGEWADPPMSGFWKTKENYAKNKPYVCCTDVDATLRVYSGLRKELRRTGQIDIMEDNIVPLSQIAFDMRVAGLRCDTVLLPGIKSELTRSADAARNTLQDATGISSEFASAQLQDWAYGSHKLPIQKSLKPPFSTTLDKRAVETLLSKLKSGSKDTNHLSSTDRAEAIQGLSALAEARKYGKLVSAFLQIDTDRVHPTMCLSGTATGRMSYKNPNMQQLPPSTRALWLPDEYDGEDGVLVGGDYTQMEFLYMMYEAEEWDIVKKVQSGQFDAHALVASLMFNIRYEDVTTELRKRGKTTGFGILYGSSAANTAIRNNLIAENVEEWYTRYKLQFPGVDTYINARMNDVRRLGYVQSRHGWRRYLRDRSVGIAAENEYTRAINTPIQSGAAMIARRAMVELAKQLPAPARLWLMAHDEIVVSTPRSLAARVHECMQDVMTAPVPELPAMQIGQGSGMKFPVSIHEGRHYGELK